MAVLGCPGFQGNPLGLLSQHLVGHEELGLPSAGQRKPWLASSEGPVLPSSQHGTLLTASSWDFMGVMDVSSSTC